MTVSGQSMFDTWLYPLQPHINGATPENKRRIAKRLYAYGYTKPNYPMPALLQDSQSDLAVRWSHWMDTDRSFGIKY